MTMRPRVRVFRALLLLSPLLGPGPAAALEIVPGTLIVERSVDGGASWPFLIPCASGTTTVYKGDMLRVSMSLRNNNGVLGSLFGAFTTQFHECGANPGYVCPPSPGNPADVPPAVAEGDLVTQEDWALGRWGGEMWIWPRLGPPPCAAGPTSPCPNEPFPTRGTSPVSIVSGMSVTVFDFNGEYYGVVEEFDPAGPTWTTMSPMPTPRSRFGMAADDAGNLVAAGGRSDLGILGVVESFDATAGPGGTWTALAPLPTARADLAVANWSGTIFAIGGQDASGVFGTVEVFDPVQNVWWTTGSLNTPRYGASAVVSPLDGKLYVIGGFDATGMPLAEIEQYDESTGTWISGYAFLNFPRGFAGAAVDPGTGYILIAGGYDGTIMRMETEVFDAPSMFVNLMGSPVPGPWGACGPEGRGRFGFAGDGTGQIYAFGGMWGGCGFNLLHYASLPDPAFFGMGGEDHVYDPSIDTWTPLASSMTVARWDLATGARGGKLYAVGGYSGPRWLPTATPDVAHITWVLRAEANWAALDLAVFAMGQDDGVDMTTFGGQPASGISDEGTYFNCADASACGGGVTTGTDGTNGQIFEDNCGGTITIRSPLEISPEVRPLSGTRPPQTVYIGDTFELAIAATNYGGAFTLGGPDACVSASLEPGGSLCFPFPFGTQGGCAVGSIAPTSHAIPYAYPALGIETVTWTYSIAGAGGADPCGVAGVGSGTVYLNVNLYGAGAYATVYVVPPPLSIAGTVFLDPDGTAAGAYGWSPLAGGYGPLNDRAGVFYYQGEEDLLVSFIYTNTSPTYSFDIAPALDAGIYAAALQISAPVVNGSLLLAPGASTTVSWVVERDPAGSLQGCLPHDGGEPQMVGVLGFNTVVRGLQGFASVEMRDHPFHPVPFDAADDCPGGCPAGSRNLTFQVPSSLPAGASFVTSLMARNTADRPFVLDASATLWMEAFNVTGSVTMTGAPAAGAISWGPGQALNFSWTFTAVNAGRVCFNAGIDFFSAAPPCHRACRDGAGYCAPRSPAYPPDPNGCELLILVPGILQVAAFTASPALSCDEGSQLTTVAITIRNTSTVYCGQVDQICNTAPEGYAAGMPLLGSYASYVSGPFPSLFPVPPVIPPGGELTVTYYMDAICPSPSGGLLEFGCLAKSGLVYGQAVDCAFGTVVNSNDVPAWSPTAPIQITAPAALWCSAWTDNDRYSVGQTITVSVTLENQGGDDLTGFGAAVYAKVALGGAVAPLSGPVPPVPWTYSGSGLCSSTPPYNASQTFVWTFQALSRGKVTFTATAQGWDAGCGNFKWTDCLMPEIVIADEAKLSVSAYADGLITMSVTCTGCPPQSGCDPVSGVGCIDVTLKASNFGGVDLACFEVPDGLDVFQPCPGCATAYAPATLACTPPGPAQCGDCIPCAAQGCDGQPGCQPAAQQAPPACSATAMWNPGAFPGCPGTVLQAGDTRAYRWRYAPSGLGCFRANVWARGNDDATCDALFAADGLPTGILEGSGTTNCIQVKARYPLELSLVGAPAQIAPGQEFVVQVRVCNPGDTAGGVQGGEPALQFYEAGTGAKITEQYDVIPPPPDVLGVGECRVIDVRVTAHKNAAPGGVEIRVPQGALFIATDAETGLPFLARDTGAALLVSVINPANRFVVVGDNQTRILRQPVVFSYQIADAGAGAGRTTLKIYTLSGELVRTLIDKPAAVEDVTVSWDGRNEAGQTVAGGVYLARLEAPSMKDGKVVKVPILK